MFTLSPALSTVSIKPQPTVPEHVTVAGSANQSHAPRDLGDEKLIPFFYLPTRRRLSQDAAAPGQMAHRSPTCSSPDEMGRFGAGFLRAMHSDK